MDLVIDNETYTRVFRPKERLILLGAGHIAQPLCEIASMLGFAVIVVDDRPLFANHPRFPQAEHIVCDAFPHAIEQLQIHAGDYVAVISRGIGMSLPAMPHAAHCASIAIASVVVRNVRIT